MEINICNNKNIHLIGIQDEYRNRISDSIKKGLEMASSILKYSSSVEVVVFDSEDWDVHKKLNLSAHARIYYIDIKICFYRKGLDFNHLFNVDIPATIYHELAHVVRVNSVGYAENLLQDIIDEGIACYIEKFSKLGPSQPYINPIDGEDKYFNEARKHFKERLDYNLHSRWFYGSADLPEWIGYRLGYLMVNKFMEGNKVGIDELVRLRAEVIANL